MPDFDELVRTLQDTGGVSYRRRNAATALGELGEERVLQPLLGALADGDKYVRRAAIQALGKLGDRSAVSALIDKLEDEDNETRSEAVKALGEIGDPAAAPALQTALKDSSYGVYTAAQRALEQIGEKPEPPEKPADQPPADAKSGGKFEPTAKPARTKKTVKVNITALMEGTLKHTDITHTKRGSNHSLTVPLPNGRKQKVIVSFSAKDDDGAPLVTLQSICAPENPKLYREALKMNARLPYGAVGVARVDGQGYFVLVDTQLARSAQPVELRKSIMTLAAKADAIEKNLTGGADVR